MARPAGDSPHAQLKTFMARYRPEVAQIGRAALTALRTQLPGTAEMVYDNYNALVIGFSTSERPSDAILSIGLYARWVNLYFLQDATSLPDPDGLLRGAGNVVRSVRLTSPDDIGKPAVRALINEAVTRADPPLDRKRRRQLTIRAVAPKHRPRK
jgi:hypothetical protein